MTKPRGAVTMRTSSEAEARSMALTMVHLLVADRWAQSHPEYLDCPEYYYGAISPDAIHVRDGGDKSHKDEIHLYNWNTPRPQNVLAYWQTRASAFDIGYGIHVLTDGQWVPRYKQRLPGLMREDGFLNTDIYYVDTFVTDFRLLSQRPRLEELLQIIARAETPEDHPLLMGYMFSRWRETLLEAYQRPCPKSGEVRFIDEAYVDAFVEDSQALLDETYAAFQDLMKQRP